MVSETTAFGAPLVGLVVGMVIMGFGIFQSGLNTITYAGLAVGFLSVVFLVAAAYRVESRDAAHAGGH